MGAQNFNASSTTTSISTNHSSELSQIHVPSRRTTLATPYLLGWKIEYKPRINGVTRDGDWYVTSPSKKGYRSLRTLRDALLK